MPVATVIQSGSADGGVQNVLRVVIESVLFGDGRWGPASCLSALARPEAMTPWAVGPIRGAAGPCQQPPDALHQKLTSEAYMESLQRPPGGVSCGLSRAPGAVYGEAASSRRLIMSSARHTPQARHPQCLLADIGSWVVRAGRPDCHEPVYRRKPAARGGTGRAARPWPRLTHQSRLRPDPSATTIAMRSSMCARPVSNSSSQWY
jgi:hypothetical protein